MHKGMVEIVEGVFVEEQTLLKCARKKNGLMNLAKELGGDDWLRVYVSFKGCLSLVRALELWDSGGYRGMNGWNVFVKLVSREDWQSFDRK